MLLLLLLLAAAWCAVVVMLKNSYYVPPPLDSFAPSCYVMCGGTMNHEANEVYLGCAASKNQFQPRLWGCCGLQEGSVSVSAHGSGERLHRLRNGSARAVLPAAILSSGQRSSCELSRRSRTGSAAALQAFWAFWGASLVRGGVRGSWCVCAAQHTGCAWPSGLQGSCPLPAAPPEGLHSPPGSGQRRRRPGLHAS